MDLTSVYAIGSVLIISLISILAAMPLFIKKKVPQKVLLFLLSVSVGVLLSTVFFHFIPEMMHHHYNHMTAITIMLGFLIMFLLEKLVHWHHNKKCEHDNCGHGHAYHLAPINILGDAIHNFIDGIVIAASFSVNITLGITSTISIVFHEIPQELADFGVLLYAGLSKKKALFFNFISALTAVVGTILGLVMVEKIHWFTDLAIPFAAGNFLYIAATNLLPQLHRHCKIKDTVIHMLAILLGMGLILLVLFLGPGHGH